MNKLNIKIRRDNWNGMGEQRNDGRPNGMRHLSPNGMRNQSRRACNEPTADKMEWAMWVEAHCNENDEQMKEKFHWRNRCNEMTADQDGMIDWKISDHSPMGNQIEARKANNPIPRTKTESELVRISQWTSKKGYSVEHVALGLNIEKWYVKGHVDYWDEKKKNCGSKGTVMERWEIERQARSWKLEQWLIDRRAELVWRGTNCQVLRWSTKIVSLKGTEMKWARNWMTNNKCEGTTVAISSCRLKGENEWLKDTASSEMESMIEGCDPA